MLDTNDHSYSKRSLKPHLILAIALFVMSITMGFVATPEFPGDMLQEFGQILEPLASFGPAALFIVIFLNNAIKSLGAIVMGIAVGLPSLFFAGFNGFTIGVVVAALKPIVGYGVIAASLAPHGIIEIPVLLLSTALGLSIGMESLRYLIGQKSMVRAQLRRGLKVYLKWILASIFIAAVIEVFVTPQIILLVGGDKLTLP